MDVHFFVSLEIVWFYKISLTCVFDCLHVILTECWHDRVTIRQSCSHFYSLFLVFALTVGNRASFSHTLLQHKVSRPLIVTIFDSFYVVADIQYSILDPLLIFCVIVETIKKIFFFFEQIFLCFSTFLVLKFVSVESSLKNFFWQFEMNDDGCLFCNILCHCQKLFFCISHVINKILDIRSINEVTLNRIFLKSIKNLNLKFSHSLRHFHNHQILLMLYHFKARNFMLYLFILFKWINAPFAAVSLSQMYIHVLSIQLYLTHSARNGQFGTLFDMFANFTQIHLLQAKMASSYLWDQIYFFSNVGFTILNVLVEHFQGWFVTVLAVHYRYVPTFQLHFLNIFWQCDTKYKRSIGINRREFTKIIVVLPLFYSFLNIFLSKKSGEDDLNLMMWIFFRVEAMWCRFFLRKQNVLQIDCLKV